MAEGLTELVTTINQLLLWWFIIILLVIVVFQVSIYYLCPYSSFLLNVVARQQVAHLAIQNTQLVEIQKSKILKGEGMGPFQSLKCIFKT